MVLAEQQGWTEGEWLDRDPKALGVNGDFLGVGAIIQKP